MKKFIFLFVLSISLLACGQQDPINKIIERNNSLSGQMIDDLTKFNKAFISDDIFYYDYIMIDCENIKNEFSKKVFEKNMSETLKTVINTLEEFKIIGELGKSIIFKYSCPDQSLISEIKFDYHAGKFSYIRKDSEWNEAVDLMYEKMFNPN